MKKTNLRKTVFLGLFYALVAFIAYRTNKKEDADLAVCNLGRENKLCRDVGFYERYIKRMLDIVISAVGLIVTAPIIAVVSFAVFIEDPANPIFVQKRVGINSTYFNIHKLRSMKKNAGDIPTHLLTKEEQDRLILRTGRIIRRLSIDELPQLFDILRGRMTLVGPRPALWNQDDLVAEREKYGANSVKPGLTGWAQINGRDELEIPIKAKFDGEYVKALRRSSISGFIMDVRCLIGTVSAVLSSKGVVEGGTGKKTAADTDRLQDPDSVKGFGGRRVSPDLKAKKKVLLTGKGSYIGRSFIEYANENYPDNFEIDELDLKDNSWRRVDFSQYDIVYHLAGIAHSDIGDADEKTKKMYYDVNTSLAVDAALKAKREKVPVFIFMSSMIVYGNAAPYGKRKQITSKTSPAPANFYGDSKWQADKKIRNLADKDFKTVVLRPPFIYGPGCKGNYVSLAGLARRLPIFPMAENRRSMLYIGNLCEFLCRLMLVDETEFSGKGNIFFPQNREYTETFYMVDRIHLANTGRRIFPTKAVNPLIGIVSGMNGRAGALVNKAFGNFCYDRELSEYPGIEYQLYSLEESIDITESVNKERAAGAYSSADPFCNKGRS